MAAALPCRSLGAAARIDVQGRLAGDPQRPQFHLLPAKNWMNDPNGPIYSGGQYHMFFQYNPTAAVWGDMCWNHAVSPDMLHWSHRPLALEPTPNSPDSFGCFSGSTIQVDRRVCALYTGVRKSSPALATLRDGKITVQESQCLAWSDDADLLKWTKAPKPVVPLPPPGLAVTGFRDPSVWKADGGYYMTVGSGIANQGGCVLLYRSPDLHHWTYLHPLASGAWSGTKTTNPCDDGEMWECPEFFPLDGGHVLIYSTMGKVFWTSGHLDQAKMTFAPQKQDLLDAGAFYAPKTQRDAEGRRVLWGWIQEQRPEAAMQAAGWSGMMSLPRRLSLDPDGTLRMEVVPAAAILRGRSLPTSTGAGELAATLPHANGEVLCTAGDEAMTFTLRAGSSELLRLVYAPRTHSFAIDDKEVTLQPGDSPTLHAFVDASVVEAIVGGRTGYTKRFYLLGDPAPDLTASVQGRGNLTLKAWAVNPISPNRLSTPYSS